MSPQTEHRINIQNIYYLLCYAWNKLDEREITDVKEDGITTLLDLLASVLSNGVSYVLHQGLDRSYRDVEESVKGVRGKLNLSQSIKSGQLYNNQTHCTFDEFDHDVLHNQVLKATLKKLLQIDNLDKPLKKRIYANYQRFGPISDIQVTAKTFTRIQLNRNNGFYDFLLRICETIQSSIFFNEENGEWRFREFEQDEKRMRYLFQAFVRKFYEEEMNCIMRPGRIDWQVKSTTKEAQRYLPKMLTDMTMGYQGRNIIIDTKYYKKTLNFKGKRKTIHSTHLYQLYSYLKNMEAKENIKLEGILLYPVVTDNYRFEYMFEGHKISVHTINLNQHHTEIAKALKKIIE